MFVYVCIYVYIHKVQINTETLQNKQKIQYDNLLTIIFIIFITKLVMLMDAKKFLVLKYNI